MKESRGLYGPLMMLGAAVCFALGGVLCKLIPWSAFAINGARNLIAAAVMGGYLMLRHHKLKWNKTVFFGAVCMFGVTTLFIIANKMTTAANAIILQYTAPIWIIFFLMVFFHQRPNVLEIGTIAVIGVGILCFFYDSLAGGSPLGDLIAILAGAFYAGVFLLNQFEDGDALSSLFFGQLASGVLLSPFVFRETSFVPTVLLAVFVLGFVQVGVAYILFSEGTRYTSPVTASLIAAVEPVLNPILVAVFWHETLRSVSLLGAFIVVAAVLAYNVRKSKETK